MQVHIHNPQVKFVHQGHRVKVKSQDTIILAYYYKDGLCRQVARPRRRIQSNRPWCGHVIGAANKRVRVCCSRLVRLQLLKGSLVIRNLTRQFVRFVCISFFHKFQKILNLRRSSKKRNTKYDFCKSPASNGTALVAYNDAFNNFLMKKISSTNQTRTRHHQLFTDVSITDVKFLKFPPFNDKWSL